MENSKKYTRKEFIAFFMLYAAHVDIEYLDSEKEFIKEKLSDQSYKEVYNDFIDLSDYEALQVILSYKDQYFPSDEKKEELLGEIKTLFYTDGDFSVMEKGLLAFLNRML